jgi:hypothetical protein
MATTVTNKDKAFYFATSIAARIHAIQTLIVQGKWEEASEEALSLKDDVDKLEYNCYFARNER